MIRARLFLSSFTPLFALLALRFRPWQLWVPCAVLALSGAVLLAGLLRSRRRVVANPRSFVNVRDEGQQVAGYLAAYILPLLVVAQPTARDAAAYGGFLVVFALVFVRSDLLQVNPLLYLFGYRLLAADEQSSGVTYYLLAAAGRGTPESGVLHVSDISGNLLLLKRVVVRD